RRTAPQALVRAARPCCKYGQGRPVESGAARAAPVFDSSRSIVNATAGGELPHPARIQVGFEQAVPQTEAAKRHYAGGSCRGGTGVPKKRGCVFWGAPQTRPRSAFTLCEVDPSLAVRTSIQQLMTAILSQRACGTRAGLKPAPTSFAMCFPSRVCGNARLPSPTSGPRGTVAVQPDRASGVNGPQDRRICACIQTRTPFLNDWKPPKGLACYPIIS